MIICMRLWSHALINQVGNQRSTLALYVKWPTLITTYTEVDTVYLLKLKIQNYVLFVNKSKHYIDTYKTQHVLTEMGLQVTSSYS